MPSIHPQQIIIRGQEWTILDRRMRTHAGWCFYALDDDPVNEIWIKSDIKEYDALETIMHEVLHAMFPDLKEEVVEQLAKEFSKILWDLGYRNEDWDS